MSQTEEEVFEPKNLVRYPITSFPIRNVKVYTKNALITRILPNCKFHQGEQIIVFSGLTTLKEGSLRVLVPNDKLNVLEVVLKTRKQKKVNDQTTRNQITSELEILEKQKADLLSEGIRIDTQENFISDYMESILNVSHGNDKVDEVLEKNTLESVVKVMEFYATQGKQIDEKSQKLHKQIKELNEKIIKINKDLSQEPPAIEYVPILECHALISSEEDLQGDLEINYMVQNAIWTPIYDLRVDSKTEKCLVYYSAIICQNTKEEWKDCNISLSTTDPTFKSQPPELSQINVGFYKPTVGTYSKRRQTSSKFEVEKKVMRKKKETIRRDDSEEDEDEEEPQEELKVINSKVESGSVSSTFSINKPTTIPSDNAPHTVFVALVELSNCTFEHFCVPKLDQHAYTKLNAVNPSDFPFLAGMVNVFFDNTFVSKSSIGNVAKFEKFQAFLGSDPTIKVEYRPPHKLRETKGFFNGTVKMNVERRIVIKNTKQKAVQMVIMDQLPSPSNNSIVVSLVTPSPDLTSETNKLKVLTNVPLDSKTTASRIKLLDTNNIEWTLLLNSLTEVVIPFSYSVSYPSHQVITPDY